MTRSPIAETLLPDGRSLVLTMAEPADLPVMREVIIDAFSHRPAIEPAPGALTETPEHLAAKLADGFGVLALVDGEPVGVVIVSDERRSDEALPGRDLGDPAAARGCDSGGAAAFGPDSDASSPHGSVPGDTGLQRGQRPDGGFAAAAPRRAAGLHRVSVRPRYQRTGVASFMLGVVGDLLAVRGFAEVRIAARAEFPDTVGWWRRHGFVPYAREGTVVFLRHPVAVRVEAATAPAMRELGERLAVLLRPGDVIIASGELGAGKTTLAQGIGDGLGVAGPVVSPTFVLSRVHRAAAGRPTFVHVDAYRLGSFAELEDIDLDVSLDDSVTYIEWGEGIAEGLADDRLDIDIRRGLDPADDTRWVFLMPVGGRWETARDELRGLGSVGEADDVTAGGTASGQWHAVPEGEVAEMPQRSTTSLTEKESA